MGTVAVDFSQAQRSLPRISRFSVEYTPFWRKAAVPAKPHVRVISPLIRSGHPGCKVLPPESGERRRNWVPPHRVQRGPRLAGMERSVFQYDGGS